MSQRRLHPWGLIALSVGCAASREVSAPRAPSPGEVFGRPLPAQVSVTLSTDDGEVHCTLTPPRTPRGAALFVALARGGHPWRDPRTHALATRALLPGTAFHRVIPGVLVQGGCPLGDGTGHPGYRIPAEPSPDDLERLSLPGALVLARYTPPPGRVDPHPPPRGAVHGSQFAVGLVPLPHLAGEVTVLGRCQDLDVLSALSRHTEGPRPRLRAVRVRW